MDTRNPMRRKISPESPIYIPFVFNLILLVIGGCMYIYYATELPTVDDLGRLATASVTQPLTNGR
jgi:hypothetical protein